MDRIMFRADVGAHPRPSHDRPLGLLLLSHR